VLIDPGSGLRRITNGFMAKWFRVKNIYFELGKLNLSNLFFTIP
jgi:hypothetical protein